MNPGLGGAKKDSGGKDRKSVKEDLVNTRQLWADLQNQKFEELGIEARVDHRSYRERGIDKIPEKHLGFGGVMALSDDDVGAINLRRKGDSNQV